MPSLRFVFVLMAMVALTTAMVFFESVSSQFGVFRSPPVSSEVQVNDDLPEVAPPSAAEADFATVTLGDDDDVRQQ